jgi:hypothetical protein
MVEPVYLPDGAAITVVEAIVEELVEKVVN